MKSQAAKMVGNEKSCMPKYHVSTYWVWHCLQSWQSLNITANGLTTETQNFASYPCVHSAEAHATVLHGCHIGKPTCQKHTARAAMKSSEKCSSWKHTSWYDITANSRTPHTAEHSDQTPIVLVVLQHLLQCSHSCLKGRWNCQAARVNGLDSVLRPHQEACVKLLVACVVHNTDALPITPHKTTACKDRV